ncbi:type II toxin-antitoxin system PemK/MazF family toxin [Tessaracoccus sp. OH4464_COT-324]|uniref:type II toxin-antitoxin system PemK/MazF family toxin n=1 Tax=Tessaracoccus sp. OH4464_COT-324 TaxID=2491059 RepID=UPI000F62DF47|nr:type II toxin-antitoxin system PemK/MazF family toxin [Tessaracoccus sp. OH4464_COT-324]RRD47155.1 type II toxin-antitoxin system PemK/MazF family toxin [Tessaracoccus sp. OH4464_COT-324]
MSWRGLLKKVVDFGLRELFKPSPQRRRARGDERPTPASQPAAGDGYPGDYRGRLRPMYEPHPDGLPDPGEVVWTWVPFEEDHSRGKDRPVLLVGRDGPWLLALQLTSRDHDRDAAQEARRGRYWVEIGVGKWDRHGRVSEVRVNRIIRVAPDAVRRIGAVLDRATFERVARAVAEHS